MTYNLHSHLKERIFSNAHLNSLSLHTVIAILRHPLKNMNLSSHTGRHKLLFYKPL